MCLAKEHVISIKNVLSRLESDYEKLKVKNQKLDQELSSMYHSIEIGRFSGVGGYKKLRDLQVLLRERRLVKHEISSIQSFMYKINLPSIKERVHKAEKNIEETDKGNREYRKGWNVSIEGLLKTNQFAKEVSQSRDS